MCAEAVSVVQAVYNTVGTVVTVHSVVHLVCQGMQAVVLSVVSVV